MFHTIANHYNEIAKLSKVMFWITLITQRKKVIHVQLFKTAHLNTIN